MCPKISKVQVFNYLFTINGKKAKKKYLINRKFQFQNLGEEACETEGKMTHNYTQETRYTILWYQYFHIA